jgi:transposase
MAVSGDTLLRILRQTPLDEYLTPRVLGVDDWAMRKGHIYGTILVDLEQRQVIDLLPDREANTLATWLWAHPGVEIICRDRASDYAQGATRGAPQAIQIADRWHLLKNLGEALQRFLNGQTKVLRQVAHLVQDISLPSVSTPNPAIAPPLTPVPASLARRHHLFLEVKRLAAEGLSKRAIARQLHLHRVTVDRYLEADEVPHRQPPQCISKAAPYKSYILRRIVEDRCSIRQVWEELHAQGYGGTYASIQRAFRRWHAWEGRWAAHKPIVSTPRPLSPRQAMWLLVRDPEQLSSDQQRSRDLLCHLSPDIAAAYALAQRFVQMFQLHQVDTLDPWLEDALHSPVPALRHFARSLQQDYAAVRASLVFDWSSGQVEGQVNRLKVIKRIMYGRAKLDLLRLRVLHPP